MNNLILAIICLFIVISLGATPAAEYNYTKLRQELTAEITALKARVVSLEAACPGGPINVYTVDSAAGTITCRSCKFEDGEKK